MINTNRIVPIERVDLLSLYGLILKQDSNNASMVALQANDVEGDFTASTGVYLAAQPLKSCDFSGASGTVYFVADYAYEGFTKAGAAVTMAGDEINPDACTLYKAALSSGTVTITKIGF